MDELPGRHLAHQELLPVLREHLRVTDRIVSFEVGELAEQQVVAKLLSLFGAPRSGSAAPGRCQLLGGCRHYGRWPALERSEGASRDGPLADMEWQKREKSSACATTVTATINVNSGMALTASNTGAIGQVNRAPRYGVPDHRAGFSIRNRTSMTFQGHR